MKKRTKLILTLSSILFLLFCGSIYLYKDRILFEKTASDIFQSELKQDTLNLHYTIAYPKNWNLDDYNAVLKPYSKEAKEESAQEIESYLNALSKLDVKKLNKTESLDYELIYDYMQSEKENLKYFYFNEPLAPNSGMQSQLPILLAEYTLRTKTDIEDYLSILDQTDTYFEGLALYEKEKSEMGLMMPDSGIQKIITQCDSILKQSELENGTHFLVTTFEERLSSLVEDEVITEQEKSMYQKENNRLLVSVMKPAYDKLADSLSLLLGSGTNEEGLMHYENGRDYYVALLKKTICSEKDMKSIKDMLKTRFTVLTSELTTLILDNQSQAAAQSKLTAAPFPLETPEEMIEQLRGAMKGDFPAFPSKKSPISSQVIKQVSESLQEYSSPAFYLTPPIDDLTGNTIYINPKNKAYGLSLYTTLAHEGYPGHLYQTVYSTLSHEKTNISPLRHLLYYGGYVEGWALYTEMLSYDYAKSLLPSEDKISPFIYDLEKADQELRLCLYSILDIAIHYDGLSQEKAAQLLSQVGISDPQSAKSIYEYIRDEPGNYLKYYMGYLQILQLKKQAKSLWMNDYSDLKFHTYLLNMGPCDFDTLESLMPSTLRRQ